MANKKESATATENFKEANKLASDGFSMLSKPEILKMREMKDGDQFVCTIDGVQASTNPEIKQPLFQATMAEGNVRVLIPAQASLANQLINGQGKCEFIGKKIRITKTGEKESNKWRDPATGKGKLFPIYTVEVAA